MNVALAIRWRRQVLAFAFVLIHGFGLWSHAQAQPSAAEHEPEQERKARMTFLQSMIDAVALETSGPMPQRLVRTENPILKYTNPVTNAHGDGATFLWLHGKRPLAAVSLSFRQNNAVYWELSSLADGPLLLTRNGMMVWQPKSSSRPSQPIPQAPAAAESAAARMTQMRGIARKFSMQEFRRGQWQAGRLLTQPLYRWEDDRGGVIDGALFGFAETTDPELLLAIEARRASSTSQPRWYFQLAKMTSSEMKVSFEETEVWSAAGYWKNPRGPEDSYVEAPIAVYPPTR